METISPGADRAVQPPDPLRRGSGAALMLDSLLPPGTILAPQSLAGPDSIARGSPVFSGSLLAVVGELPVLCHAAAVSPRARALRAGAGLDLPPRLRSYESEEEYLAALRELAAAGGRIVSVQPFAAGLLPPTAWLVPPALVADLNDKGRLGDLVPGGMAPRRRRMPVADLPLWLERRRNRPAVVKLAGSAPSGSGSSVRIVRRRRHLARALAMAATHDSVLVEEWLPVRRNYCVVAAALPGGEVRHLGTSDQLCSRRGMHLGNWLDARRPPAAAAIELGLAVVRQGATLGYLGVAGIDVVELPDGQVRAIDLNFRFVSSTAFVLLAQRLAAESGAPYLRHAIGGFAGSPVAIERAVALLERRQRAGRLRILNFFDAVPASPHPDSCHFEAVLLGDGPGEVERQLGELRRSGFAFRRDEPGLLARLAGSAGRRLRWNTLTGARQPRD